ncbi:MAG TPA: hypothetical protein PLC35_07620, partial [Methanosarcina vacuolata]|nr:hypothetical protein [Methanosarcina vacuolata]
QVELCREELLRSAIFLQSIEHPVVFMGSPGVGKTTAICALTKGLRDLNEKDLNRQMTLQTGSGRTTICEVHVRSAGEYAITIEPCSEEELRYHVADFCEYLLNQTEKGDDNVTREGSGISAEVERTLRNMTGLMVKKVKREDGKYHREDPATELVKVYPQKEKLLVEIFARLNITKRQRTSIAYSHVSSIEPIKWLSKTFSEINFGRHPEFSLPRRIEVSIPGNILGTDELSVRLIDTRGIDEPSAPRRDLQSYLDNERAVIVLCSRFGDAPSADIQAQIERAKDGGLHNAILERGLLLILPKDGEEKAVLSDITGEPVTDSDEGREIRLEQVKTTTLADLGVRDLSINFMNIQQSKDCEFVRNSVLSVIQKLRVSASKKIESLIQTVDDLIKNKADEQVRLVFDQATKPLKTWLANNRTIEGSINRADQALLEEIDSLRYAASLRASVSRRGNWHNFDYWHGLGFGSRRNTVSASKKQLTVLEGLIQNTLNEEDLREAHSFVTHFRSRFNDAVASFFVDIQQLGEAVFAEPLKSEYNYWNQCQNRWGMGTGYKYDIRNWTEEWFSKDSCIEKHAFLEDEIQRRWAQMVEQLAQTIESVSEYNVSSTPS